MADPMRLLEKLAGLCGAPGVGATGAVFAADKLELRNLAGWPSAVGHTSCGCGLNLRSTLVRIANQHNDGSLRANPSPSGPRGRRARAESRFVTLSKKLSEIRNTGGL